ncbi:unnamed protein product [Tuber melanosporum]|uniref:(Perigord truffle) hypothetical protein n=1 Tax=Tuber melanosporum (strain Mel28) TaxID=656061 RepID=D5GIQ5_TUBMM|nr:uncharacterized protein GSTUM_00008609001 [Tuber melanosporum]CAZ84398.1 unnamed protein product [Tuber melanosporum]
MAGTYSGRRSGVNVSSYIENLNSITADEPLPDLQDDLALFTNISWIDYDMCRPLDDGTSDALKRSEDFAALDQKPSDEQMNFMNDIDSSFVLSKFALDGALETQPTTDIVNPFAPDGTSSIGPVDSVMHSPASNSPTAYPQANNGTRTSAKRKGSAVSVAYTSPQADSFEEASRLAAEEDKRRRNTAASARFRVKKKQREQALERSAKEMSEKVRLLEKKIVQLETENKWLKSLIVEKQTPNSGKGAQDPSEDFAAKSPAAMKAGASSNEPNTNQNKDGVGTMPEVNSN